MALLLRMDDNDDVFVTVPVDDFVGVDDAIACDNGTGEADPSPHSSNPSSDEPMLTLNLF